MYLMNVPPVAATQTEWRRCGPPGSYSLPACFNDSDSELSTRETPISDKVQMIIESLRSSQSSLEMGDEIQGQECHTRVFKDPVGSSKNPAENPQPRFSSTNHHENSGSDSDDSVDRGIEEAILEYLKEKDGHKHKAEHESSFLQTSKIPSKASPFPDVSKHSSDSSTSLTSMSHFPTRVQAEAPTAAATGPLKKYIKNKASRDENFDLNPSLVSSKSCPEPAGLFNKTTPFSLKKEEDSDDSSSDDGIEEAIQRYQLEKQEQLNRQETFGLHPFRRESDSTSDDGIEEAIRSYQLEQLREKSGQKSLLHNQKPSDASLIHATSSDNRKRHKLKRKKVRTENQTFPSSDRKPRSSLPDFPKHKGQPVSAPPKVNTTAELMCAEAILDISKTVLPGPFHQGVGLSTQGPTDAPLLPSLPDTLPHEDSSSVDSEDGIEQEIRRFLEQKAQMHNQPVNIQEPKEVSVPKKPQRLSLTQRRRQKEKNLHVLNMSGAGDRQTEHNSELTEESTPSAFPQRSPTQPATAAHQPEQSGDKSSSLDSDEDLDTAIKDLLKTKKKSKKKIRDVKKKPRKCVRVEEPMSGNTVPTKKFKLDYVSKCGALKSNHKDKDKDGLVEEGGDSQSQLPAHGGDSQRLLSAQINNDSSSVDSDDSIEQEIRRFLAEKAKVSSADSLKDGHMCRNGTVLVQHGHMKPEDGHLKPEGGLIKPEDIKTEAQQAEILPEPRGLLFASPSGPAEDQTPRKLLSGVSPASPQSCVSSVLSCSPSLLEPADGAGAARNQQRRPNTGGDHVVPPQPARGGPSLSSLSAQSQAESIKWRQSLGLPPFSDKRAPTRTKFHITTSENRETASETNSYQNRDLRVQTPASAWFSSRTSTAPFSCSSETAVKATVRPPVLKFCSAARQNSHVTFPLSLRPGHSSQFSLGEDRASMVHVPKDKSVFVELETNRTNHVQVQSRTNQAQVQVQSRDRSEGKERCRSDEEVPEDRKNEEFVDESDCESDSKTEPEQKQGFSSLSLCRAIDPGITFHPCIALTSEERRTTFSTGNLLGKWKKGNGGWTLPHVKRKLQFLSVNRREAHL
ncbi:protein phosphatase 1 regulatory subunit 26 isoform X1 [Kryptolebias marmoratus]|uniref:protein phosphatase 1 regulatory subunit 26 isoform X1 n=1 Tax=Kryptolebias marmoratus TaxID=37003 RepID=UPI0007F91656|nr:protein phosphatase 1 regulatory subunit 26 isoform X1 [Kryptolebias marmoratus]